MVGADSVTFQCPTSATVDQAEARIRSRFGLLGGGLQDREGDLVDGSKAIGDTLGEVLFVDDKPVANGEFQSPIILLLL